MLKKRISVLTIIALLLTQAACNAKTNGGQSNGQSNKVTGSGALKTETRPVNGFNTVVFSGVGELLITQDEQESLVIEAEENILGLIETKVEKGTLYIGFKKGVVNINPTKPIRYTLAVINLIGLTSSGAGNIQMGELNSSVLDVELSGAGKLKIEGLGIGSLAVLLSGAGDSEVVGGNVENLKLEITGAGSFRAPDLQIDVADVNITGLGSARLWVNKMLDVTLSGTGSVEYYGQPKVTQLVSGFGKVKSLGDHP